MATMVVRMALDSQGIPVNDHGRNSAIAPWTASGNPDYGTCVRTIDGAYVTPVIGTAVGPWLGFLLDSGDLTTLAAASTSINSITATAVHRRDNVSGLGLGHPIFVDVLYGEPNSGLEVDYLFAHYVPNDQVDNFSAALPSTTTVVATDPAGGAWTIAKLQTAIFYLNFYIGNGAGVDTYYVEQFYITVDYVAAPVIPTTSVTIIGSGGIEFDGVIVGGGTSGAIAVGSGTPPELHGNQWGLLQFVMKSRLEERI